MTDILCDEAMEAMPLVVSQDDSFQLVTDLARNLRDPKKSLEFMDAANSLVKAMFE